MNYVTPTPNDVNNSNFQFELDYQNHWFICPFQCTNGNVSGLYATGKALLDIGVIPGNDMTPEAALTKMAYVLSKDEWDIATKRQMMQA